MEFGYSIQVSKNIGLRWIFTIIKWLSKICTTRKYYRVESIKYKNENDEFIITFFNPGERVLFQRTASELLKSTELITKFTASDALIIGFCVSSPLPEQINKIVKFIVE